MATSSQHGGAISQETTRFGRSIASFLLGCIVLALLTFVCFQLHTTFAVAALLYLVAIVLISLQGRFVLALLSSVVALLCLDYFFVWPIFAFGPIKPEDIVALFTFLTTALVVTALVSRMRTSQQQWKEVFENNPTMYFIVDANGTVTSVNPFGAEQLGYSVNELVGQPVVDVFYEPDRPVVQKAFAECVRQLGKSMSWEFRKVRKDGSVIWVRETAKAVERASGPIVLVACEDITLAKRSQQELEQAFQEIQALRDQFRLIIDTIPDMIWSALPDGSVDFVNQRWVEYTGVSLEDGLEEARRRGLPSSRHVDSLIHPEDAVKLEEWRASNRDRISRTGEPFEAEFRFRRADGEYRWVTNRAVPLRDKQGKVIKWYGASIDIEDRKRAEEALRASEERWSKLAENSSAGIALIAPDGRFIVANLALQKMLGYTEEELQGRGLSDITHEEDRAATEARIQEASEGQRRVYRVEKRFLPKDGSVVWADVSTVFVPASGSSPAFFAAVIVDITERKQAEDELRRSEVFLAQGQRISHTGSWGWHVASGSNYWSQEHYRIFEYDPESERPSYSLFVEKIHPEDRDRIEEILNRAVREKSDFEFEYRIVLRDGSIKFLRSVGERVVNPTGELEFIGTSIDVTDLKRAEEMQIAVVREREMLMRQRAADLAKANEALRSCLDTLASVPELDAFIGQVMAGIARQLGAVSSTLRVLDVDQKEMRMELLFQDGSVISPDDASYPERFQSLSLEELGFASLEQPYVVLNLSDPRALEMPADMRAYLQGLGVRTLLVIPLLSQGHVDGVLSFGFEEDRHFQVEELEIARALATQASLAIQLTGLARTAKQSAVLEERNELAGEIHDSLAQFFSGISMHLGMAKEVIETGDDNGLTYVQRAAELAQHGLAEARRSAFSLQSNVTEESGLIEALQKLVERTNIPGSLHCNFRSHGVTEKSLPPSAQQGLLRIAQEAIGNAARHAKPTVISVDVRWEPPNLVLEVTDDGSGISNLQQASRGGFGLSNMRARAEKLGAQFDVRTRAGRGTSIVVLLPIN